MAITPTGVYATSSSVVPVGGTAITLIYGPVLGGIIVNPSTAEDQGLSVVEVLYVDVFEAATLGETPTSVAIQPGQTFNVPANQTTNVSVNAVSSGHRFSAITFQPQSDVIPAELIGLTNPCLQDVIPSYLYQQYANDEDLQAFVAAYNTLSQQYVTWFNDINLPVYTGPLIVGDLLDWVALGLYGVARPILSAGAAIAVGPFNTYPLNGRAFNSLNIDHSSEVFTLVDDDIFKRILTWKLYKGDGKQIDIRWLKRRILRFLLGDNGADVSTADTQQISITFSDENLVTLTIVEDTYVNVSQGNAFNVPAFNTLGFNIGSPIPTLVQVIETYTHGNQINIELLSSPTPLPNVELFKEAVDSGVLDMPFQFKTVVTIS